MIPNKENPMPLKREPVLILEAVKAAITAAVAFGFKMSADQIIATYALVAAVISVVVRQRVSPIDEP